MAVAAGYPKTPGKDLKHMDQKDHSVEHKKAVEEAAKNAQDAWTKSFFPQVAAPETDPETDQSSGETSNA